MTILWSLQTPTIQNSNVVLLRHGRSKKVSTKILAVKNLHNLTYCRPSSGRRRTAPGAGNPAAQPPTSPAVGSSVAMIVGEIRGYCGYSGYSPVAQPPPSPAGGSSVAVTGFNNTGWILWPLGLHLYSLTVDIKTAYVQFRVDR